MDMVYSINYLATAVKVWSSTALKQRDRRAVLVLVIVRMEPTLFNSSMKVTLCGSRCLHSVRSCHDMGPCIKLVTPCSGTRLLTQCSDNSSSCLWNLKQNSQLRPHYVNVTHQSPYVKLEWWQYTPAAMLGCSRD